MGVGGRGSVCRAGIYGIVMNGATGERVHERCYESKMTFIVCILGFWDRSDDTSVAYDPGLNYD